MNLNQITLPSRDVARAISFYEQLGLQLIVRSLPGYARFLCPDGGSTLSVHLVEKGFTNGAIIYFECEQLDETVARLVQQGIDFDSLPEDKSWRWREAELTDPDGNRIKLFFGGEDRVDPPWRVGK